MTPDEAQQRAEMMGSIFDWRGGRKNLNDSSSPIITMSGVNHKWSITWSWAGYYGHVDVCQPHEEAPHDQGRFG